MITWPALVHSRTRAARSGLGKCGGSDQTLYNPHQISPEVILQTVDSHFYRECSQSACSGRPVSQSCRPGLILWEDVGFPGCLLGPELARKVQP